MARALRVRTSGSDDFRYLPFTVIPCGPLNCPSPEFVNFLYRAPILSSMRTLVEIIEMRTVNEGDR
jgi:hypothetical protein